MGKHVLDKRNEAGEGLLQFCALIELVNGYEHLNNIHYGSWMHPTTKVSHMIDLIVVRAGQQFCYIDVYVMRRQLLDISLN